MSAKLSGSKTLYWIDKRLKSRNFQNDTNAINYEAAEASQYVFFPNLELAATAISNSGQVAKWRAANREPVETSLIYPQKIREAISSAPPVYRCMYDRMSAYRKDILQETGWISPLSLLFWTAAPPDELTVQGLADATNTPDEHHPLQVIGPIIDKCPGTFGEAINLLARNLPADAAILQADYQQKVDEMLGLSAATNADGNTHALSSVLSPLLDVTRGSPVWRMSEYFAVYQAYGTQCRGVGDPNWIEMDLEVNSDRLGLQFADKAWVEAEEANRFKLMWAAQIPLFLAIWDTLPHHDFSLSETWNRSVESYDEILVGFSELIDQQGCSGKEVAAILASTQESLPKIDARPGEKNVMAFYEDTGPTSIQILLESPFDPVFSGVQNAENGRASVKSSDDGKYPLGSDFFGQVLSHVANGNFKDADAVVNAEIKSQFQLMRDLGPKGKNNPIADYFEAIGTIAQKNGRLGNLFTTYAIRRVELIGACGDNLIEMSQVTHNFQESRDGYGSLVDRQELSPNTNYATIPERFVDIVNRSGNLSPSIAAQHGIDEIIKRLSCDSDLRRHLEENMFSYYKGQPPAWREQDAERVYQPSSGPDAGKSAYKYIGPDDAEKVINEARSGESSSISLDFPYKPGEKSLNLVRIDGVPAIAFYSRKFGDRGDFKGGDIPVFILTCRGDGRLAFSQLFFHDEKTEPSNDLPYTINYRAFGGDSWKFDAHLERIYDNPQTIVRFVGEVGAATAFKNLRATTNLQASVTGSDGITFSGGMNGERADETIGAIISQCRTRQ
ncbi:hypothetical protein JYP51_22070 [Ponticoccus gilvus]|nr:hypothetical protein [Enemella evansiae]